ncbi:polysaccharide deacetylase family protein [Candidatus Poribacteria bacterium]|nr:MAG: polysaccharide deacetylase family protein [Candidatus Poribacteria bacterium]
MINILTIDVEDYFHVLGLSSVIKKSEWEDCPQRVYGNTLRLLDILEASGVKATFYVLGWVAERRPELVDEMLRRGHEIASHGYSHAPIYEQTREEFHADLVRSKEILEGISGCKVIGYRAPSFSITERTLWALDVLIEEGFEYDSSIYPIRYDRYGISSAERFPHLIHRGKRSIWEFPPSTLRFLGRNLPVAGGGYFRLYPYRITAGFIRRMNRKGYPVLVYLHPWEIDPAQPRFKPRFRDRFRHYVNLSKTEGKLIRLLKEFRFAGISHFIKCMGGGSLR